MSAIGEIRATITTKLKERDALEQKIKELQEVEKVQMKGLPPGSSLVDNEGFPLAQIDVHAVRITRHDLICAQNDYKALAGELEKLMYSLHSLYLAEAGTPAAADAKKNKDEAEAKAPEVVKSPEHQEAKKPLVPFLRVGTVVSGSPAAIGGLQEDDLICVFGNAKKDSTVNIGQVVQEAARDRVSVPLFQYGLIRSILYLDISHNVHSTDTKHMNQIDEVIVNKKTLVYVGGLDDNVTEEILENAFIPFGPLKQIMLPREDSGERHRGFAFVEFEDPADAQAAMDNMHDAELFGRVLTCNLANPKNARTQGVWNREEWMKEGAKTTEEVDAEIRQRQAQDLQ